MLRPVLALMLLAACGSPQRPKTATPCADAAAGVRRVFDATTADAGLPPEIAPRVQAITEERCRADGWTAEASSCLAAATDAQGAEQCVDTTLTDEQKQSYQRAVLAEFPQQESDGSTGAGEGGGMRSIDDPCGGDADGADPCGGGE